MSYLTQMLGLAVQSFFSAATPGMAIVVALIRGFVRRSMETIGNFWVDMTRHALHSLAAFADPCGCPGKPGGDSELRRLSNRAAP